MDIIGEEQTLVGIFYSFALALIVLYIAKWAGFFRLPAKTHIHRIFLLQTLGAFLLYLILALFAFPFITLIVGFLISGDFLGFKSLSRYLLAWLQVVTLLVIFLCLVWYCRWIKRGSAYAIFWGEDERSWQRFFKTLGMGVVTLFVSYPFVLFVNALTAWIIFSTWGAFQVEQVAVKQLKATLGYPYLFASMVFIVVVLVPFMEELLFRGFLQSLLKRYLGRSWAIILTAVVFALVHFAPSQGVGNFQLIPSLFVLACFIGFIYERESALWAPIALHMTFNAASIFMILLDI